MLWSHIGSLYWIVLGTLACKYLLIPVLFEDEQTFHSSVKENGSLREQHHESKNKIRQWILTILTFFPIIYPQCIHFVVDSCVFLDAFQKWTGLFTKQVSWCTLIERWINSQTKNLFNPTFHLKRLHFPIKDGFKDLFDWGRLSVNHITVKWD